jgi:hypothetical protein
MINRRQSLGIAAGLAATPVFSSSFAAAASGVAAVTPANANAAAIAALVADPLLTHVRMRGHQDGRRCFFSYHGTFYAQVSGQRTQPMFHIEGASSARMQRQSDGSFLYTMREAGWFCDLQTNEPQAEATNPLTGKLIKPRHYNSAQQSRLTREGVVPMIEKRPPGLEYVGTIGTPVVDTDVIWSTEELLVKMPGATPGAPGRVQTSLATFSSNLAELLRGPEAFVGCRLGYQTLGSFLGWMEMGDATGVISWRLAGRKSDQVEQIPPALRARIEREHPEVLTV